MALKTLDGLPEEVAALYKKGDDGEFHLETDGLKSALQKERERANAAEKAVKEREAREAAEKADAERKELERKGEYEKLTAQAKAENERLLKELSERDTRLQEHLKESAAIAALGAAGLKVNRLLLAELKGSLEVVQGKVIAKGDPAKTPDQILAQLRQDPELAGLFPASGSGAGSPPPGNPAPKPWNEMNLDERSNLWKSNPAQAQALQTKG